MDDTVGNTTRNTEGRRRLDLKTAAAELGVTSEAIRRRAKRGTLPSEKGEDGLLYVWLPNVPDGVYGGAHGVSGNGAHAVYDAGIHGVSGNGAHAGESADQLTSHLPEALLERYEDENGFLRQELERLHRELERKDAILLTMAQRIPELEPARETSSEPLQRSGPPSEEGGSSNTPSEQVEFPQQPRSWLSRFFFGP